MSRPDSAHGLRSPARGGVSAEGREKRLNEILGQVFERPAEERRWFLEQACGDDDLLFEEALALLDHEEEVGDFLESPALASKLSSSDFFSDLSAASDTGAEGWVSPSSATFSSISAGSELGAYTIVERLGAGGVGEVYRARDRELQRDVAIKVLQPKLTRRDESMRRFRREARLLASVNHPNIATIHGLEEAGGIRFLVMELVEGRNLAERLKERPLSTVEALKINRQIARALEAAHKRGIIHRDLKPANVMVSPEGWVKVLDFGLAKALGAGAVPVDVGQAMDALVAEFVTTDETITSGLMGTAPYMSPEQLREQKVDRRSDIWAFGCVVFECVTGKRPFQGGNKIEIFNAILEHEPPWEILPPDLPQPIRQMMGRCLRKDPELRLQSMGDARIEMEEVLQTYSMSALQPLPPSTQYPPTGATDVSSFASSPLSTSQEITLTQPTAQVAPPAEPPMRHPAQAFWAAGAAVLALALVLGAWWWRGRQAESSPPVDPAVAQLMQQGRFYSRLYRNQGREGDKEHALEAFEKAFEIDPRHADAAGEIALLYTASLDRGLFPVEVLHEIRTWAERAIEIDPHSGKAWAALGYIEADRQPESYRRRLAYLLKAAAYAPRDADVLNRLGSPLTKNSLTLAVAATREASRADPLILISPLFEALCLGALGRSEEALERVDAALEIEPDFGFAWWAKSLLLSISDQEEAGRAVVDERLAPLAAEEKIHPSWVSVAEDFAAFAAASRRGDAAEADAAAQRLLVMARGEKPFPRWQSVTTEVASQLARWGRSEEAVELIRQRSEQEILLPYDYLLFAGNLDSIREDPRFQEVLEEAHQRFDVMMAIIDEARSQDEMPEFLEQPVAELMKRIRRVRQGDGG